MSLAEVLPIVETLSQSEKLNLIKLLTVQFSEPEIKAVFSDREYQVLSLHDSYEAADILMQMVKDDREAMVNG